MSAIPPKSAGKRTKPSSDFHPPVRETVLGACGFFADVDAVRTRWERIVAR